MATIINASETIVLLGAVNRGLVPELDVPPPPPVSGEIRMNFSFTLLPGQTYSYPQQYSGKGAEYYYFYQSPAHWNFFNGILRSRSNVYVDPEAKQVTVADSGITQADLDSFKGMFPDDTQLQALTLNQLQQYAQQAQQKDPWGKLAQANPNPRPARGIVSECNWQKGMVIFDCFLALFGLWGLWNKVPRSSIEDIAVSAEAQLSAIENLAGVLGSATASTYDQAKAIFQIANLVYTGGAFEAVYKAIMKSLTWWDMVLYGVLGLAEIAGAFLTDGALIIAEIAAELALFGFIASDVAKMVEACA